MDYLKLAASELDEAVMPTIRMAIEGYCERNHRFTFDPAKPVVRLHEPTIGPKEIIAAVETLLSTKVTMGPKSLAFEREFCSGYGLGHGVACNSGSSANLLIVAALCDADAERPLMPGDEVIVSALSWSTTIWPLVQHGLVPVIVDIDPATFNIDVKQAARAISRKTRAIMPVHVYGNPCDMQALEELCIEHDLLLIEDCCEAFGAYYKEQPVGGFGIAGSFSFYLSHHITTLEGGIAATASFELAERMRILRAHGWIRDVEDKKPYIEAHPEIDPKFLFVGLGYNLRITELQAAIGRLQVPKLQGYIETRRENNKAYAEALGKYDFLRFQKETTDGYSSCFDFALVVRERAPFTALALSEHLAAANIETRPVIAGNMAQQPGMKRHKHRTIGQLPHATNILRNGISIGNHHFVNAEARDYVIGKIGELVK